MREKITREGDNNRPDCLAPFLKGLVEEKGISAKKLSVCSGVSAATVSRWLAGKDIPSPKACQRLSDCLGIPLMQLLLLADHLPYLPDKRPAAWPEFREYAKLKYPQELDDDSIAMIERLIEVRRDGRKVGPSIST